MAGATPSPATWSLVSSPNPSKSLSSELNAVSCAGPDNCAAVGDYYPGHGVELPLAEERNGASWKLETVPIPSSSSALLSGVSCTSSDACVAVGYSVTAAPNPLVRALAELWNGSDWAQEVTPLPSRAAWVSLSAVSCTGPDDCTAVGGYIKTAANAQEQPLVEHWNGNTWAVETVPNPHAENGALLSAVSCTAPNACTAAGGYTYADVVNAVFAYRWNGSTWSHENQQNPLGGEMNIDASVSCSGDSACTSVGTWVDDNGLTQPLVEYWGGKSWTRQSAPDPVGADVTELAGISCPTAHVCQAVGNTASNYNGYPAVTLAEGWNGTAWVLDTTPDQVGAIYSTLNGVTCASASDCVAVGSTSPSSSKTNTLVEVYAPTG